LRSSARSALVGRTRAGPFDVGTNPLGLVGELSAMRDPGDARADDIGDAERPEEPFAIGERGVEDGRGDVVALGRHGLVGSLSAGGHPLEYRWLELGHREQAPLIYAPPRWIARGWDQPCLGVQVGQLEADRRGLEQEAAVVYG